MVGVPIAPKLTAVLSHIKVTTAAATGGNPKLTNSGAAKAAGVPNPAAPSINEENIQPIMMACILASLEMDLKPLLIECMPPLSFSIFITIIAPVIVTNTSIEFKIPLNE